MKSTILRLNIILCHSVNVRILAFIVKPSPRNNFSLFPQSRRQLLFRVGDFDCSFLRGEHTSSSSGSKSMKRHMLTSAGGGVEHSHGECVQNDGRGTMYKVSTREEINQCNKWIRISFDEINDTTASFAPKNKGQKKQKGLDYNRKESTNHTEHGANKNDNDFANNQCSTSASSATMPGDNSTSHNVIPESVLQYERQLRKLRASDRASKTNVNIQDHLRTVYVDEHIVVVNKSSGILCVPGVNGHRSMLDLVYDVYGNQSVTNADARGTALTNLSVDDYRRNSKAISHDNFVETSTTATTTSLSKDSMVVHRLDMDTSGIVIFARTRTAMAKLHESFRDRAGAKKIYEALLVGWLEIDQWIDAAQKNTIEEQGESTIMIISEQSNKDNNKKEIENHDTDNNILANHPLGGGEIHLPLQRDHKHPPFMRVSTPESEAEARQAVVDLNHAGYAKLLAKRPKPSTTQFRILSREEWMGYPVTRVELVPITGRTHQLRVHCAALGHPILGDPVYGYCGEAHAHGGFDEEELRSVSPTLAPLDLQSEVERLVQEHGRTMCLHARKLMLDHPVTKESMTFEVAPSF